MLGFSCYNQANINALALLATAESMADFASGLRSYETSMAEPTIPSFRFKDLSGQTFGRLTVLRYVGQNEKKWFLFLCRCECGNEVVKSGYALRQKWVESCGCLKADHLRKLGKERSARPKAPKKRKPYTPRPRKRRVDALPEEEHKARRLESQRAWRERNKERERLRGVQYRQEHPDKTRESVRKHQAAHPEQSRQRANKRRAVKLKATVGDTRQMAAWEKRWRAKKAVRCYWCRESFSPKDCHVDHIVPLSKGGAHALENLAISCQPCNQRKYAHDLETWNAQLKQPVLL